MLFLHADVGRVGPAGVEWPSVTRSGDDHHPTTHGIGRASPTGPSPIRQPAPPTGVLRALLGLPVHLYHAHLGVLLGYRFLLLVHTGRKTGLHRETVLEVVRYDPATRESVVAAGWGRKTGWLHRVEAGLAHEMCTGRQRFAPAYRILPPDEAKRPFADYERRNRLIAPIIRAVLSRLLGWHYDGTPAARGGRSSSSRSWPSAHSPMGNLLRRNLVSCRKARVSVSVTRSTSSRVAGREGIGAASVGVARIVRAGL